MNIAGKNETSEMTKKYAKKKKVNNNEMNAQRCQVLHLDCDWLGVRCQGNLHKQINK